jgi:MFS family permease
VSVLPDKEMHFFTSKRFFPLFITQFLGAFNDNVFRQAILILIAFRFAEELHVATPILTNLAVGLFILPFFIFSALAGQLADKYEKSTQIVWIKIWEIALMILGTAAFYIESLPLMIAILAGLGLQSTFFGPIKYGILPDLMRRDELLKANALIEASTFIAMLTGTIIGGIYIIGEGGLMQISAFMIIIAILGTVSGWFVPNTGRADPDLKIQFNIFRSTQELLKKSWANEISRRAIICISWIWLLGTLFIAQIPDIVKNHLGGDEDIVTLFMASFSIGIGFGSILCSRLLKGEITAKLAVPGLITLALVSALLFATVSGVKPNMAVQSLPQFLSEPMNIIITILLITIAVATGVVVVPLYAVLQDRSERSERSRIMAANNIVNSGFMAGGSLVAAALIGFGITSAQVLLLTGLINLLFLPVVRRLRASLD